MTRMRFPVVASLAAAAILPLGLSAQTAAADTSLARRADHARVMGSPSATVWLVEVSDFQCPFCRRWHDSTYAAIVHDYVATGKIRLAYINFPLTMHKNAMPAAQAAMCAAAQDKFWPMQDALFNAQDAWETLANPAPVFDSLAAASGVKVAAMRKCIATGAMTATIEGDVDRAKTAGVQSTPTFLIGGEMITGAQPLPAFRAAIDAALARAAGAATAKP
jgi:protein-disulfide isomerase